MRWHTLHLGQALRAQARGRHALEEPPQQALRGRAQKVRHREPPAQDQLHRLLAVVGLERQPSEVERVRDEQEKAAAS
jgi:hypothetical protein